MKISPHYQLIFLSLLVVVLLTGCQNDIQTTDAPMQKQQQLIMFTAPSKAIGQDFIDDIYTISTDDHELKQLTSTGKIGIAYFSPYADKILYSEHYDAAAFHWYLMDSDGQNQQRLTDKPVAANVKWSPAEDLILYDQYTPSTDERNLILHNTETGTEQEIPAPLRLADYTVAPEGRAWCLIEQAGGNGYELLAQQANDTKKWEKLIAEADVPDTIRFAGWSPYGKHLLLNSYESGQYNLWLMERPEHNKGQIKPPYRWHSGRSPVWNSDGSRLAFIDKGGIWTAELGQPPYIFWPGEYISDISPPEQNITELLRWVGDEVVFKMRNKNTVITIAKTDGRRQTVLTTVTPPKAPTGENTSQD